MSVDVALKPGQNVSNELKQPSMYRVLFHNDDYTAMDFVVFVLEHVFHKSTQDAHTIMLKVHNEGLAVVGIYTYDVAETKRQLTLKLAKEHEYPLLVTIEELTDK